MSRALKTTWKWWLAGLLGLIIALVLAAIPLGRHHAQEIAAERIEAEAARRGWRATWADIEVGLDAVVVVRGLRLSGPASASVHIDSVEATFDARALLEGERTPEQVHVDGVEAALDLSAIKNQESRVDTDTYRPKNPSLPSFALRVTRASARLSGLPAGLGPVSLEAMTLEGQRQGERWEARLGARCARGCKGSQGLDVALWLAPEGWGATADLSPPARVEVPWRSQTIEVQVGRLGASSAETGVILGAEALKTTLSASGWRAEVAVARASTTLIDRQPGLLLVEGPTVSLARLDPDEDGPEGAGTGSGPTALERFAQLRDLALEASKRVEVQGGAISVEGESFEGIHLKAVEGGAEIGGHWRGAGRVTLREGLMGFDADLDGLEVAPLTSRLDLPLGMRLGGELTGQLKIRFDAPRPTEALKGLLIEASLKIAQGHLHIPALSEAPIEGQSAHLDLKATWTPPQTRPKALDRAVLHHLKLGLPSLRGGEPVALAIEGSVKGLTGARAPIIEGAIEVEEVECDRALTAIPRALMPALHGKVEASGRFAPSARFSVDMRDAETLRLILKGLPDTCRIDAIAKPHDPARLNTDFIQEVREGVSKAGIRVGPGVEGYTPLRAMPAWVGAAAYLSEEANFRTNRGFDLGLMRRAIRTNLKEGRYVYGGSSVSQQLVKNLFLTRNKTLSRKLEEAIIVWRMEAIVSKDRILELYLNCIEFGPDLYGIGPAAQRYFRKPASKLSPLEASFLASIKPAPWYGERFFKNGRTPSTGWWQTRLVYIMERLHEKGFITQESLDDADPYVVYFRR